MSGLSPETQARLASCRTLSSLLRVAPVEKRNRVLTEAASLLSSHAAGILKANAEDLAALPTSATPAFRDRLKLDPERLKQAAESLRQVARLPDPLAGEVDRRTLANGLKLTRIRSPLGVILMIFESRPNVALEAFSLALKSGNFVILRGGKESMRTTTAIYEVLREALTAAGLPEDAFWGIDDPDRALVKSLLKQRQWIDVVVPRGGDALIEFVVENSSIPIIKNDRGLCHVYIDEKADVPMALRIVVNAKTQRPGVCNSMETVLVHQSLEAQIIPELYEQMKSFNVEWHGCPRTLKLLAGKPQVQAATAESWDTEYLDFKVNCRVVKSIDEAMGHIEEHGSRHSEAIVTADEKAARRFQAEVDAAAVYWNASTRFTDGFEFGLGGELGISTQKLHVRGPVGLVELTSVRWVIDGTGQTRA